MAMKPNDDDSMLSAKEARWLRVVNYLHSKGVYVDGTSDELLDVVEQLMAAEERDKQTQTRRCPICKGDPAEVMASGHCSTCNDTGVVPWPVLPPEAV